MRIHLIHGIHTTPENSNVPGLIPYLKGPVYNVATPNYGYILAAETRRLNPSVVSMLCPYVEGGDVLVGHSNGCAIIYAMLDTLINSGNAPRGVVFINAALERQITLPSAIEWADVYFNGGDLATEVASIAAWLGTAPRTWGEMGHAGYLGTDARITNHDCGNTPGMPKVNGHSDLFTPANLPMWGKFIGDRITSLTNLGLPATPILGAPIT
jgi:hypothetical protein